jgi:hypothetical protein
MYRNCTVVLYSAIAGREGREGSVVENSLRFSISVHPNEMSTSK